MSGCPGSAPFPDLCRAANDQVRHDAPIRAAAMKEQAGSLGKTVTNKCAKKRVSKKQPKFVSPKVVKSPKVDKQIKEKPLTCPSHKTKEECDKNDCLWGKTNKCSKKRVSKKL